MGRVGVGGGVLIGVEEEGEAAVLAVDDIEWDGGRVGVPVEVVVNALLGGEEDVVE